MKYRYGDFSENQIVAAKKQMRKQIFFLLLIVDPNTKDEYINIDIPDAIENVLYTFSGFNDLMYEPPEMVEVMSLLNAAYLEFQSDNFDWQKYRKLILDAGNAVLKIKEV